MAIGIAVNLFGLGYYKYGTFLWQLTGDAAARWASIAAGGARDPAADRDFVLHFSGDLLPHRRLPARNLGRWHYGEFATYHSLFPQFIAGPIVRYREIKLEMQQRAIDRTC